MNLRKPGLSAVRPSDWLTAELAAWTKRLESGPSQDRPTIRKTLGQWLQNADVAAIRDEASLSRLPTKEREEFTQLWANVTEAPFRDLAPLNKRLAALSAAEQVEEVRKELKKLNPDYDGTLKPTIENDAVIGMEFTTDHVADISPVRALTRLQRLALRGSYFKKGLLTDLTPLKGMPLKSLDVGGNQVTDLTPLKGVPLEKLDMWQGFWGTDLTPLEGMPLKSLNCGGGGQKLDLTPLAGSRLEFLCVNHTKVSDLAPLKNVPLKELLCSNTPVSDLNPLRGMRLRQLNIENCKVSNIGPVKGMPLNELDIKGTSVTDLSPLKDLPIKMLNCDFQAPRDAKTLGAIKTLETINGVTAKKFWETERTKRSPAPASNRG